MNEFDGTEGLAVEDLRLAERAQVDRSAAEELLRRIEPRVRYAVKLLMRNDRDVDDVLGQTMLEILESIGTYKGRGSLEAWAGRIAYYTVSGHTKRRSMIERVMIGDKDDVGITFVNPEMETARHHLRKKFQLILNKLPTERRQTLVLRLVLGHSIQEIAEMTKVPINTVRSRLRTGLRELRRGIGGEQKFLGAP
jgi:RNA polymerase sigma-70 factor (ECF subfamily)